MIKRAGRVMSHRYLLKGPSGLRLSLFKMTELSFFSVEGLKYRIEYHNIYRLTYCAVKMEFDPRTIPY